MQVSFFAELSVSSLDESVMLVAVVSEGVVEASLELLRPLIRLKAETIVS